MGTRLALRVVGIEFCGSQATAIESLKGKAIMKLVKLAIVIAVIAVALFLTLPNLSWAVR
jgi:hypothetical protein